MITEQFEIIDIFSKGFDIELTINQIAKKINKSYAFTNKYTHELITKGILNKKTVGSAILCSLNFQIEQTIACLVYNSIQKKSKLKNLEQYDEYIKNNPDKTLFLYKKELFIISGVDVEAFKNIILKYDLSKITVIQGHEKFWKLIAGVMT